MMSINFKRNLLFKDNSLLSFGNHFFNLGIFFLPSALPIAGIFLLLALIISFSKASFNIFKEKWNFYLIICSFLFILSTLYNYINFPNQFKDIERTTLWIQLLNWIPLFFVFMGSKPYLKTELQRERLMKFLLMGSMPVLFSCVLHYFNFNGPFGLFNDSIVWFMKPRSTSVTTAAVSGLFNNSNYTATWLAMIWPCSITLLIKNKNKFQRFTLSLISLLIFIFAILTASRNAILGIFVSTSVVIGSKSLIIVGLLLIIFIIGLFNFNFISSVNILSFLEKNQLIILKQIVEKNLLIIEDFSIIKILPRISIWKETISLLIQKPFFGWGAGTFFFLMGIKNIKHINTPTHTHNILLEITYNYGIFATVSLAAFVMLIIYKVGRIIFINDQRIIFSTIKALYSSILVALIFNMTDVTYYDGKISILIWILLSSLRCFLLETNSIKK